MTTYRMYRCNLCSDYLEPTDSTAKPGFGVHFVPGGAAVFKRVHETERHICHQCARSVHDELRKVTPEQRQQSCGAVLGGAGRERSSSWPCDSGMKDA